MTGFSVLAVALCVALLNSATAGAVDSTWTLLKDRDGVQVYSQPVAGSPINRVRGVTVLQTNLNRLVTLLRDPTLRPSWDDFCGESYLHKKINSTEELVYLHSKLPWPVKDRDMLMRMRWSQDEASLQVTMEGHAVSDQLATVNGRVRLSLANNSWQLTPMTDGTIEVVTTIHLDPAGPLPAWLINRLSVDSPYRSLINIKRLVADDKFQLQQFDFIREPDAM